jgi:hypothetical protein
MIVSSWRERLNRYKYLNLFRSSFQTSLNDRLLTTVIRMRSNTTGSVGSNGKRDLRFEHHLIEHRMGIVSRDFVQLGSTPIIQYFRFNAGQSAKIDDRLAITVVGQ